MKTEISKDSHGFEVKKRRFSLRLIFKFILTFALCIYALYRCSLRSCAAENDTVTLTPAQTLALYGTTINGLRYNENNEPVGCSFSYVGLSSDYVGSGSYGQNIPILGDISGASTTTSNYCKTILQEKPFLIYKYVWNSALGSIPLYDSRKLYFSFQLTPNLAGITNYEGQFCFSCGGYQVQYPAVRSTALFNTTAGVKTWQIQSGWGTSAVLKTCLQAPDQYGVVPEDKELSCTFTTNIDSNAVYFNNERYNLSNIDFAWYGADGIRQSFVTGFNIEYYFYIQCPTIWNYTPPIVTTAATTRRPDYSVLPPQSTAAPYTVDLSDLESGVAAIVAQEIEVNNNLDWIGSNIYIGVNNLAAICDKLDKIYAKMWALGEIENTEGLSPPSFENLREFAMSALATQASNALTTTRYNMKQSFTPFFDVGGSLLGSPIFKPFVVVVSAALIMAVISFILFRGH